MMVWNGQQGTDTYYLVTTYCIHIRNTRWNV